MKIIEATFEDVENIIELNNDVHKMHITWFPKTYKPLNKTLLKKFFKDLLDSNNIKIFIAKNKNKLLGYIKLNITRQEESLFIYEQYFIEIDQISISKNSIGKGTGKALINKAKEYAMNQNITKLILKVKSKNINAIEAYEKLGFQTTTKKMELDLKTGG
jgi:ribosomal protein S18 acetylase RimI-like enzyme